MSKTARTAATKTPVSTLAEATACVLQFKITLLNTEPPIWRRIQVVPETLGDLHMAIQSAMGWEDSHLFEFEIGKRRFSDLDPEMPTWDEDAADAFETPLLDFIPDNKRKKLRFRYLYDFGDSWEHEVLFEGRRELGPKTRYPLCLEGERACPPEDCGGVWGFYDLLGALDDPQNEQHDYYREWLGEYDAESFDAQAATRRMQGWR